MLRIVYLLVTVLDCVAFARFGWQSRAAAAVTPGASALHTLLAACTSATAVEGSAENPIQMTHLHVTEYPDDDFSHVLGFNDSQHQLSRLQSISALRIADTVRNKIPLDTDGCGIDRSFYISSDDLLEDITDFDDQYGKPVNLLQRIAAAAAADGAGGMAVAAEFKRASPSKGDINVHLDAVEQCMDYADVGAAVISVLTESQHFKGYLRDMKRVRIATQEQYGREHRPAILRKDFIFDRYQILEARAHGADTVLLIVAVLGVNQLHDLITYSRKMGMEPLVEVNTEKEIQIALEAGAMVIGVNNRNLHNFQLDMKTTERAIREAERLGYQIGLPDGSSDDMKRVTVAALSGISSRDDVQSFRSLGVSCCLIGETLMKSPDPKKTIGDLLRIESSDKGKGVADTSARSIVKICGFKRAEDVQEALQEGANLIGVIFAAGSPRTVSDITAAQGIMRKVRNYGERSEGQGPYIQQQLAALRDPDTGAGTWFHKAGNLLKSITVRKPLLVGVFQDQPAAEVNSIAAEVGLDLVQLHGEESPDYIDQIELPVIKVLHMKPDSSAVSYTSPIDNSRIFDDLSSTARSYGQRAAALLMDSRVPGSAGGGTGVTFDWAHAYDLQRRFGIPVLLAGGLHAKNVRDALRQGKVLGVDVSSGVEFQGQPGVKDAEKMRTFLAQTRLKL